MRIGVLFLVAPLFALEGQQGALIRESHRPAVGLSEGPDFSLNDFFDKRTNTYYAFRRPESDSVDLGGLIGDTTNIVKIGFLDSGLMHAHPAFAGIRIVDKDFTGEGSEDQNGHGTMVALLFLADGFPKRQLELYNVKVLDRHKRGTVQAVKEGIAWAAENGVRVLNVSLGVPKYLDASVCTFAARVARRHDMLIVAAAGNDPKVPMCPAAAGDPILAVGAVGQDAPMRPDVNADPSRWTLVPIKNPAP